MKIIFRWGLLIVGAIALGMVLVLAYLALKDGMQNHSISLYIFILIWVGVWIGTGYFLRKQEKVKQPFAYGFLSGMFVAGLFLTAESYFNPSQQELLEKARDAEQDYFVLSAGSLDHSKICSAAFQAYKYYSKSKVEDKTKLFEHIIMTDKCL